MIREKVKSAAGHVIQTASDSQHAIRSLIIITIIHFHFTSKVESIDLNWSEFVGTSKAPQG